jgi:hypothetical protein
MKFPSVRCLKNQLRVAELLNAARLDRQPRWEPSKHIFATIYCDRVKSYGPCRVDEGGACVLGGSAFYIMSFLSNFSTPLAA